MLNKVALFLYSIATIFATIGVAVQFLDSKPVEIKSGIVITPTIAMVFCVVFSVLVLVAWGAYFYFGKFRTAVCKAKELSE